RVPQGHVPAGTGPARSRRLDRRQSAVRRSGRRGNVRGHTQGGRRDPEMTSRPPTTTLHRADAPPIECDVVVVGSGATGGWAAMALSAGGLNVLVLEAGPEHPPIEPGASL